MQTNNNLFSLLYAGGCCKSSALLNSMLPAMSLKIDLAISFSDWAFSSGCCQLIQISFSESSDYYFLLITVTQDTKKGMWNTF